MPIGDSPISGAPISGSEEAGSAAALAVGIIPYYYLLMLPEGIGGASILIQTGPFVWEARSGYVPGISLGQANIPGLVAHQEFIPGLTVGQLQLGQVNPSGE
jgi:hypothetical protein